MSDAIEAFVDNVNRFCDWAESDCHGLDTARHVLLALMQGVSSLPTGGAFPSIATEYECRGYEQWKDDFKRFADVPVSYYRTLLDPLNIDSEESGIGDVHNDLADIYGDLWHGLQAYNSGDIGYAVEYWRSSYDTHWGAHAAGAFSAIDAYYRS